MLGRSSRTRDVCDAIMFSSTTEKSSEIIQRMRSQDIQPMLDLENLLPVLVARKDDKNLMKALTKSGESGAKVGSLKELEKIMGTAHFQRMMKSMKK